MGTLNATIALARALADAHSRGHRPTRIINTGTAGSLIPSCSGIFEIDHVIKHDFDHETLTAITGRPLPTAGLATGDTFISDTATRDRLAQPAQLCDMEGYAVVKVAREFGIPVTLNLAFTTMAWLGLAGVGGCVTPRSPPKRRHFTPNLLKRPVWKRFGVKF
ncbi:nucleosidase [Corynebacterium diphtheriae]|nr:nucleosidase [Corynebacterium diphtheriae]UJL63481.1 nucleosidase [Corynebacterium diphtheriae]